MSFHGGFLGVLTAMWLYGRKTGRGFWQVTDFIAPLVPTGLAAGRVGNFINGELWGRPASADLPWSMVFPYVDQLPRHPRRSTRRSAKGCCCSSSCGSIRPARAPFGQCRRFS